MKAKTPIEDRFWSKVVKGDGCWRWIGAKSQGYGYLTRGGVSDGLIRAPRLSYIIHFGDIPDGMVVRHKCDNPECTNPDHLELGSRAENMADMKARNRSRRKQTHCKHGHEYTPENTKWSKRGGRSCKQCAKESQKRILREKRGDMFGIQIRTPKTHCPAGHEFTPENTYMNPSGYQECRACRSERVARFNAKRRLQP